MDPSLGHTKTQNGKPELISRLSIFNYTPKQKDIESALGTTDGSEANKRSWTNFIGNLPNGRHTSS